MVTTEVRWATYRLGLDGKSWRQMAGSSFHSRMDAFKRFEEIVKRPENKGQTFAFMHVVSKTTLTEQGKVTV